MDAKEKSSDSCHTSEAQEETSTKTKKMRVKELRGTPYVISLEKSDILGEGSFGKVVRAYDIHNPSEDLVAKIIQLNDLGRLQSIQMELKVLQKLPQHNNLVNVKKMKLSSHHKQYFIMEYCSGGTLTDFIKSNKSISEDEIIDFLQQFCMGYRVLFEMGIIHRDIKPDNILIHNDIYKIADFGLAKVVEQLKESMKLSTRGTPLYLAPELIQKTAAGPKVDMWSLGVILHKMLFNNKYPFLDPNKNYDIPHAFKDIIRNKLVIPKNTRNPQLVQLCQKMLEKNQNKRISWEDLFTHPLIQPALEAESQLQQQLDFQSADSLQQQQQMQGKEQKKGLQSSTLFAQQIEIMRTSKIRIQPMEEDRSKSMRKKQRQSIVQQPQDSESENDNNALLENNHKLLEKIIANSKRRMKEQEICLKIENYLLMLREKILFFDTVCLRLSRITEIFQITDAVFLQILWKLELLILFSALKNSHLLSQYQNQDSRFSSQDWKLFQNSDNYKMLYDLYKQDSSYLQDYMNDLTQDNAEKKDYFDFLQKCFLDSEKIQSEFEVYLIRFLQHFNWVYYLSPKTQRQCLVIFTYVYEIYTQKNISQFKIVKEYSRFYELIQSTMEEAQLYKNLMKGLVQL